MQDKRHIKRYIFCFLAFFCFFLDKNFALSSAIVIQSVQIEPYNKVYKGINGVYGKKLKKIVLYKYKGNIIKYIKQQRPGIIFAIGEWALSSVVSVKDIPIVCTMVLDPYRFISKNTNICAVSMIVSAKENLKNIKKYLPQAKNVGLVYNPKFSDYIYKDIMNCASRFHFSVVAKVISSSNQVISALRDISNKIDIFLMIPDITVITPETLSFMNLFFLKKSIPIITFSKIYLKMGAFMAIYPDPFQMGKQAGELGKKLLKKKIKPPAVLWPKEIVKINPFIAKQIGLNISKPDIRKEGDTTWK